MILDIIPLKYKIYRETKMKKQLIAIGVILILIVVGLLGGCSDSSLTNIGDLQAYPERYLGKKVKVEGMVQNYADSNGYISDQSGHFFHLKMSTFVTGWYYVTGIVKYGNSSLWLTNQYYLEVTKLEAS